MNVPESLLGLVEQGVIQEVIRPLLSGKEAQIYLVVAGGHQRVAKVYKKAQARSFKHRSEYTEGRRVRNTRDQRAMDKGTRYGRARQEDSWRTTEVDIMARLRTAGVRVPEPFAFVDGVLIMELVTDASGNPAPRLADARLNREQAERAFQILLREVVKMVCAGVVHGDLSDFNVLVGTNGPVIIDFPQAVDPSKNQNASRLLVRDVNNLGRFLRRFVAGGKIPPYGKEIWGAYENGELTPTYELTGRTRPVKKVEATSLLDEIEAIERESRERREALGLPVRPARQPKPIEEAPVKAKRSEPKREERSADGPSGRRRRRRRRPAASSNAAPEAARKGAPAERAPRDAQRKSRSASATPKRGSAAPKRGGPPQTNAESRPISPTRNRRRRGRGRSSSEAQGKADTPRSKGPVIEYVGR